MIHFSRMLGVCFTVVLSLFLTNIALAKEVGLYGTPKVISSLSYVDVGNTYNDGDASAQNDEITVDCGFENFDNSDIGSSSSYQNGSFVGNNGVTWTYVEARDENGDANSSGIDGKAIMLRRKSDNSMITSSAVPGGISDFSAKLYKGFAGAGSRQAELFVNGVSQGLSESFDDFDEHIFTVTGINIAGDVTIEIRNNTSKQLIVDDISWTCGPDVEFDCPALEANIGDACDDGDASTENDEINSDCECIGTPIDEFDCPALEANIGDACDDGDSTTENDVVTAECECVGTPITVGNLCGFENFDNAALTASYLDGSFVGNDGITWTYVASRDENGDGNGSGIDGNAIMLRQQSDDSKITSSNVPGGISDFSAKLYKGFTGSGSRQVELFINGVSEGVSSPFDDYDEHIFTVIGINITGDVTIEIRNITGKQVIVDDISWTCGPDVEFDCPALEANIGDACDDGDPTTENDEINSDCECIGTPIGEFDCPLLEANIGDDCDDGDETTENDVVTAECECVGSPITVWDCPDIEANIGDACDDGDASTENDIITADCECAGTPILIDDQCGFENFDNSDIVSSPSYQNGSFVGNNGVTWTYVASRDENGDANNSGIDGKAIMLRRKSDDSKITSSAVPGGISDFSAKLYKGFEGAGSRQAELFVNGVSHGLSESFDDFDEHIFTVTGINIAGDVTIEIRNNTSKQLIVDDIIWTCGPDVEFDCPALEANIGDACDDGDASTENDEINSDCECIGTPIDEFDCPALEANIGDACDDGDSTTENDVVTADCECVGTPIPVGNLCGFENFDNAALTASYLDGSFVGNDGITWAYVASRDENGDGNGSGIDGNAIMLRQQSDDSKITSSNVPGGISDFSAKLYKGFTGSGSRQVELFINGVSEGVSSPFDDYDEHIFTVIGINITGDVTIEIRNITDKQVIVDDISWTCGPELEFDCPALEANIGDACDDGDPGTENDTVTEDCECVGTVIYDCPALEANIGDACDDGDAGTENDTVTEDCECVGTVIYDCPALEANIGDTCDDGDPNTENDVITEDCECTGTFVCTDPQPAVTGMWVEHVEGEGMLFHWDAVPYSIGCQHQLHNADNVLIKKTTQMELEADSYMAPRWMFNYNTNYTWSIRCGCSESPIIAGPWSALNFTTPAGASLISSPNPTSGLSNVTFEVASEEHTTLEVYDMRGRIIDVLYSGMASPASEYRFQFNGTGLAAGVYIYRLTTDSEVVIEKFMIAK